MKIEDKVIEMIDYEEYLRQCKLENNCDDYFEFVKVINNE